MSEHRAKGPGKQSNTRFEKMIAAYATAAGAVGVALLTPAKPAEAEIVYTKTRVTINGIAGPYLLDLNHDGIPDFSIGFCSCRPHGTAFTVESALGVANMVMEQAGSPNSAAALPNGAPIGPKQAFRYASAVPGATMAYDGSYGYAYSGGVWMGVVDHYLGLKFMIHGQVHYGWARMTVTKHIGHVVLTGYAYETVSNKPLKAGQTSEAAADEGMNPAVFSRPGWGPSLGMLAYGSRAMDVWRRKEEV
jgi:hypothetical protein